ncbi:GNAT family N-acetyltransferase [Halomonas sp. HG01]|uniref:GNAT family N-acetyltransferase n=1 Tax=Halomonas sp. HG01 TaxID=1609967 RepID=UPI0006146B64|nr:GNAT family N-acetyltransferase [Halomonas sp. HG01]
MSITIEFLTEPHIPQLAEWHQHEWGHLDSRVDTPTRMARLQEHCEAGRLPCTFVALEDDRLVGSICLVEHDVPDRPDYTPWISRIYVSGEHRGKGIGKRLIEHAKAAIGEQGHPTLYLITEDKAPYYARIGWSTVEEYRLNGNRMDIMKTRLP